MPEAIKARQGPRVEGGPSGEGRGGGESVHEPQQGIKKY